MKRMLQLRYVDHLIRIGGQSGCRASPQRAKARSARKASSCALVGATGVWATAWNQRTGRVNWGPSVTGRMNSQPGGIRNKPSGGSQRRRCGRSKQRSGRTIQPVREPRATGLVVVVRSSGCRLVARPPTDKGPEPRCRQWRLISGRQHAREGGRGCSEFEAVLGKTHRTEF